MFLTLRRILAIPLFFVALLAGLLTLFSLEGSGVAHSIENSREIDKLFRSAGAAIASFQKAHGRRPSEAEFEEAFSRNLSAGYYVRLGPPPSGECDGRFTAASQLVPAEDILWVWRGEWVDCYAPATGASTLGLTPDDYSMTGSARWDPAFFAGIMLACALLMVALWRRWGRERESW